MIPFHQKSRWTAFIILFLFISQACNLLTPAASPASLPTEPAAAMPTRTAAVETQPPATRTLAPTAEPIPAEPEALCPTPGEGESLYISKENGYCLLIPSGFSIEKDVLRPDEVLFLLGPRESDKPKTQEEMSVYMTLASNGPADGLDNNGYAQRWHALYGEGTPYEDQTAVIGGQRAVVLSNLPAYSTYRGAFLVANGIKYQITLSPQPEDMPELAEAAQRGWDTVTGSLVFFPPQNPPTTIDPDEVCSQENSELRLYRSDKDGYCFLYPADFAPAPDFPGMIKGGPILGQWEAGDIVTYVAAGTFGHFEGQSLRQVLEPRMEQIDTASVQDATIGGYPAVTFRSFQGPWPSRQAMIMVDGDVFTLVGEPWDPERYPDGIPYLDRLWDAITGSMAFFDPWR